MCRYAGKTYKSNYACFKCKKSFKQAHPNDILVRIKKDKIFHEPKGKSVRKVGHFFTKAERSKLSELVNEIESRPIKCPECGSLMADLGKDFRVPKKGANKEWKIIEGLFRVGKYFHSCGCNGIGYIPRNLNDYKEYLKLALREYHEYIIFYQDKTTSEYPDKMERVNYWNERITDVKNEMMKQNFNMN
ncbi:hypothetical protein CEY12_09830 [Chryseobacterium sp. T16E-39]|uniref:hypothetical protein n=1 Tax=Chryseobacterium sp. T16E-39 TaxID=2015076 RepID=UPI000B5B307F|nr:hypothetical protein [Chryseobacterium sp. T16E-39]ASK30391.1 hypothetical protein CEY12_09830 [Chryseobacterium sp. T16E-39]